MVCSSNQNRSMEAHALLKKHGLQVESFGTGMKVKLPGQSASEPNCYEFGTPYTVMYKDLQQKAEEYYQKRGLLRMLERNAGVKLAPERWQLAMKRFDVACTFEERVMDQLIDDMNSRASSGVLPLLVVNLDVVDNHEEAANAAPLALRLCEMLDEADDLLEGLDATLEKFKKETQQRVLHEICYY